MCDRSFFCLFNSNWKVQKKERSHVIRCGLTRQHSSVSADHGLSITSLWNSVLSSYAFLVRSLSLLRRGMHSQKAEAVTFHKGVMEKGDLKSVTSWRYSLNLVERRGSFAWVGTFLPFRYASMDLCCLLSSSSCSNCSILNLPDRTRFFLWWYAFRYLRNIQLHDRIPSWA